MAEEKRSYQPREKKLLYEWVNLNYPNDPRWTRVRLGPIPGSPADLVYESLRRWADMVLIHNNTVFIIEAKMRIDPGAAAQLEVYARVFKDTPEFSVYKDLPVKLIYLTTVSDQTVANLCKEKGIELVIFRPSWVDEYWREKTTKP